ncbi:hypothetical protein [Pseudarthrobacter chlorophenolicus]|nr:hypothetical protein [Pseudarthrobacter chlorophenolicus]
MSSAHMSLWPMVWRRMLEFRRQTLGVCAAKPEVNRRAAPPPV